jgi:hypothetical protein
MSLSLRIIGMMSSICLRAEDKMENINTFQY